jgi:hypothetical protein
MTVPRINSAAVAATLLHRARSLPRGTWAVVGERPIEEPDWITADASPISCAEAQRLAEYGYLLIATRRGEAAWELVAQRSRALEAVGA